VKKLVRIKLINWHLFLNQTVEINQNSLLSGENGAGKSTFLDAIQYVLTGGKAKFNTAANQQAKRDLEGYIRCKLGIENKTYLRNNNVTSHIALEFYDEQSLHSIILGTVIELNKSGRIYEHFYVMKNIEIKDSLFIEDQTIRGYALFKKNLLKENIEVIFCETKEQTKKIYLDVLEIKNNKYIELIPKALAFRPIDELNKFVFDFLLNEKNVSIDDLRQNVRSYREFENLINTLSQKEAMLNEIVLIYDKYSQYEERKQLLVDLTQYSKFQQLVLKVKHITADIKEIQTILKKTQEDELYLKNKLVKAQEDIDKINQALNRNETYQYFQDLERIIKEKENDKIQVLRTVNDLLVIAGHENNLLNYTYQHIKKEDLLLCQFNFNQVFQEEVLSKQMHQIKQCYEGIKEQLLIEISNLKNEKLQINQKLEQTNEEICNLEKNQRKFEGHVERLKSLIEQEISASVQKKVRVFALCELIDVKDESWRDALEGYLNNQRFNLIIDSIYFDQALNIYEKYKQKEGLYGVGLVNTSALTTYQETNMNALAAKVHCQNQDTLGYVNLLLNQVVCCELVEDLKKHKTAITKTCMVYKNHTARQINQAIYKKPYIGMEAVKLQLKNCKMLKIELDNKRNDCIKTISIKEFYLERIKASQLDFIIQNLHSIQILNDLNQEIISTMNKSKQIKMNPEVDCFKKELIENKDNYKKIEDA